MNLTRADVVEIFNELIRFGEIKSSRIGASKSVQVGVTASDNEESPDDCDVFGQAPLMFKPPAGLECLFIQRGDEKIVIGVKTRSWQLSLGDGEVILQALGDTSPAYLHLKPNGDAVLKGANVTVDMSGETKVGLAATQFAALSNLVQTELGNIVSVYNLHTHAVPALGTSAVPVGLMAAPASVAATKTRVL